MADLPTNLKDDILDSSVNTRRKYRMIENGDGTYSFEDATEYSQVGNEYGAGLINETNRQVNEKVEKSVVVNDLDTISAITQPGFVPDALVVKEVNNSLVADIYVGDDGKLHKIQGGADSVLPFNSVKEVNGSFKLDSATTMNISFPTSGYSTLTITTSNYASGTRRLVVTTSKGDTTLNHNDTADIDVSNDDIVLFKFNTTQPYEGTYVLK